MTGLTRSTTNCNSRLQTNVLTSSTTSCDRELQIGNITYLCTTSPNCRLQINGITLYITDHYKRLILEDCLNVRNKG